MAQAGAKTGIFRWYFNISILKRIIFALVAGAVVGIIMAAMPAATAASYAASTKFFGDLFIRLLQMIVAPVIFFSVICGAASLAPSQLGRVGGKLIGLYLVTTFIAVFIGLVYANIFQPGSGLGVVGIAEAAARENTAPALAAVLLNIVPTNVFNSLAQGQVLPIIFFAICFGISLSMLRASAQSELAKLAETVFQFFSGCAEIMYKIVRGIMEYSPIGIFFLISAVFGVQGPKVIGSMFYIIAVAFLAFATHFIIVYGGLAKLCGLSPRRFFKKAEEAMITAFVTRSSNATLPITMRCLDSIGVPRSFTSFSAPFGATVNMDGAAVYLAITSMFIANAVGAPLGIGQQLMICVLATLGAIGAAGVPGASVIILLMVLEGIGLKVEAGSAIAAAYAMIFAVDAVLDMGRTLLNVSGDMIVTTTVAKSEGVLNMEQYNQDA